MVSYQKVFIQCWYRVSSNFEIWRWSHLRLKRHYWISGNDKVTLKGTFNPKDVHNHCGIKFKTPPYVDQNINEPVKVEPVSYPFQFSVLITITDRFSVEYIKLEY